MRRTVVLSRPVKAVVLAISAIWIYGGAHAAPTESESRHLESGLGEGWELIPSGTIPIPPKPKVREESEAGVDEIPSGSIPIPPKPKSNVQY